MERLDVAEGHAVDDAGVGPGEDEDVVGARAVNFIHAPAAVERLDIAEGHAVDVDGVGPPDEEDVGAAPHKAARLAENGVRARAAVERVDAPEGHAVDGAGMVQFVPPNQAEGLVGGRGHGDPAPANVPLSYPAAGRRSSER